MIKFFTDKITYKFPYGFKKKYAQWLYRVASSEGKNIRSLNIILTSDEELLSINKQFLNHYDFTDIITFDFSRQDNIYGEIYISFDRIKENAKLYDHPENVEMERIIVHGLLHLCGYTDKKPEDKKQMTRKEDYYLAFI